LQFSGQTVSGNGQAVRLDILKDEHFTPSEFSSQYVTMLLSPVLKSAHTVSETELVHDSRHFVVPARVNTCLGDLHSMQSVPVLHDLH
jgi:hypothetical protein